MEIKDLRCPKCGSGMQKAKNADIYLCLDCGARIWLVVDEAQLPQTPPNTVYYPQYTPYPIYYPKYTPYPNPVDTGYSPGPPWTTTVGPTQPGEPHCYGLRPNIR